MAGHRKQIEDLNQKGIRLDIVWTPGHADIAGNEIADRLGKEAAQEVKT